MEETLAACTRVTCLPSDVPSLAASALSAVGGRAAGPPTVLYRALNDDGTVEADICIPVAEALEFDGFVCETLPGGDVLSITHTGPYGDPGCPGGISETLDLLRTYVRAHEVALAEDPMRRVILEGEREHGADGSKHVTELQLMLFLPKWLGWFAEGLERHGGPIVRDHVMRGYERLAEELEPDAKAIWARGAMERLDASIEDPDARRRIMNSCAHRFPSETIEKLRSEYLRLGGLDELLERMSDERLYRGAKFVRSDDGGTLVCVKVPADPEGFRNATTDVERRASYCHCPFVRSTIRSGDRISPTFCNCGGGWYVQLWEGILGESVVVDVERSVARGDDCCRFVIHVPDDA